MSRYIKKTITIHRKIDKVFDALISPSLIKKWWHANAAIVLPEVGGFYTAAWGENEDDPEYITFATIREFRKPYHLSLVYEKYYAKEGALPFDTQLDVTFSLEDAREQTNLTVVQNGFPVSMAADEYYQACVKGWEDTFISLKSVLEKSD